MQLSGRALAQDPVFNSPHHKKSINSTKKEVQVYQQSWTTITAELSRIYNSGSDMTFQTQNYNKLVYELSKNLPVCTKGLR